MLGLACPTACACPFKVRPSVLSKTLFHICGKLNLPMFLLLWFCLKNTYFSFQDQFYEQVEGVAMGSPISPIVASIYMEYFELKAHSTPPQPPGFGEGMWMTHLSSRRKSTSRSSYNTLIVLTPPYNLQWRSTRRIVPSPSWTLLYNQRLMRICLSHPYRPVPAVGQSPPPLNQIKC